MPKFSEYFGLKLTQYELDFVDVNNEADTPVYVDPYAIEIRNDVWSAEASDHIRTFFLEVLAALRSNNYSKATMLMSHLREPKETFLGVSVDSPQGKGVGSIQARQLINAIKGSKAFQTGLLSDLSDMALYVEGIDRDKVSDLTTNIIRKHLTEYTKQQCDLHSIPMKPYASPSMWNTSAKRWEAGYIHLPYIQSDAVLLVPKYIVRRKLSLDSQEFYNKQITDFLIAEHLRADSALVQVVRGERKVLKKDVRDENPRSKAMIVDVVLHHPELLELYKQIAQKQKLILHSFDDEGPTLASVCSALAEELKKIPTGQKHADRYHRLITGAFTALFFPELTHPHKEWEISEGRKRIDIVFTNASDQGFFAQRRDDPNMNANLVVVECKNYSTDIANKELDQLLGRFDDNIGKFGIVAYRKADDETLLFQRCKDAAIRKRGYILALSDKDIIEMLRAKGEMRDDDVYGVLYKKFRQIIS